MLARQLQRCVYFPWGDRQWPLLFTHRVLLRAQELAGSDLLNEGLSRQSARLTRALLFAALSEAGGTYTLEEVGTHIALGGIAHVQAVLMDAWAASLPDPKPKQKSESNSKAPKYTWLEHWSAARVNHKLSSDEWLDMTPRMFHSLEDQRVKQLQREEYLVGTIAATTANFGMSRPKQPLSPEDFMLHKFEEPDESELSMGDRIMRAMKRYDPRKK